MARAIAEWIGRNDDAMPPRSCFDRLWAKQEGKDAITGLPFTSKDRVIRDHILPLADGGENRELNLHLITEQTHKAKTADEATERAKTRSLHERHRGYVRKSTKWQSQGFAPAKPQHSATRPIVRRSERETT